MWKIIWKILQAKMQLMVKGIRFQKRDNMVKTDTPTNVHFIVILMQISLHFTY